MKIEKGLYYTKDHEWVKIEEGRAYFGISDYAQKAMGDIVYVELPEIDETFEELDVISVVESVKAASDVYAPIEGTVVEVNEALDDEPGLINEAPYENWIAILKDFDKESLEELMDEEEYKKFIEVEG